MVLSIRDVSHTHKLKELVATLKKKASCVGQYFQAQHFRDPGQELEFCYIETLAHRKKEE